jgi:hypothetical protein
MAPLTQISSVIIICYLLPAATLASQQATLTSSPSSSQHFNIHKSHVFHVEPSTVVNSVLSNIQHQRRRPLLDVDVSSTKLDDDAVISLVEGILNRSTPEDETETVLNLKLEMNRITPVGVSKVFDLLVGQHDKVDETNKNVTADDIQVIDQAACEEEDGNVTAPTISSGETNTTKDDVETDLIDAASQEEETKPPVVVVKPTLHIEKLDLSYNDIGGEGINPPSAQLLNSIRRLFENENYSVIPNILLMENCGIGPAFCRSIGRGILNAYERNRIQSDESVCLYRSRPSVLRIGGNPAIGDAGAVALAAAFRMATPDDNAGGDGMIIEELDLSSCNIGDVGAEAIALALACNPSSLKRLDLSNNKITDVGAIALGRSLDESRGRTSGFVLEQIVLDNNAGISDDGAAALAKAVSSGAVRSIHLRSCSLRAEGSAEFGKALIEIVKQSKTRQLQSTEIDIDISGNPFGVSKPKKKKGAAYSASLLRDKASSNIKFIGKSLHSRLKGAGFGMGLTTAESDDDEEEMGNVMGDILSDDEDVEELDSDRLKAIARCGARSFSSEILKHGGVGAFRTNEDARLKISVGMRQCFLDSGAIDALAAAIVCVRKADTTMSIDIAMNAGIDDATIAALKGGGKEELILSTSAERHENEVKRILEAKERREAAAEVAAARVRDEFHDDDDYFDDFDYDEY